MTTVNFQGFRHHPRDREVWRYMDLPSLLWILENEKLHFSSPKEDFDDRYETTLPRAWYEFRENQWREIGGHWDHDPDEFAQRHTDRRENMRDNIYVSCWHANQTESAAMWELYGASKYTVAIRTTVDGLMRAFHSQDEYALAVGDVKYVDFDSSEEEIDDEDMKNIRRVHSGNADSVGLTLLKREEFEHEKEVRCVVLDGAVQDWLERNTEHSPKQSVEPPVNVSVDVDELIEEIRLSPGAEDWFIDTAIDAVENNRNTRFSREEIRTSQLDSERYL
ncbi:DUF2971 domain-containing protein [Halobacterium salinarum]|uniref:DUF2971 domain-containing protein n=1 Tax=Halobacterium salinarum TaxID=2242 RepID=UPI001F34B2B4|nr:DUF2971 domain-containing protein [Halobacterium salinarum]MCF2207975.1 DUF2971 domain-containing protein [Halobacterium salinarum]MCF2240559.1 DUF2971 domain-containing protein [Halobacterium salinarum]MDL0126382.1 DUF2971 domain-containing protein [Halobacterium salinarum]